jgi:hypothetical protein
MGFDPPGKNPLCFLAWSEVREYFPKAKDV